VTDDVRDLPADAEISSAATELADPVSEQSVGEEAGAESAAAATRRHGRTWTRTLRNSRIISVALILLLLISGSVATWLYFKQYRPDQQTDPGVAHAVLATASDGTVALLSYSSDTLDQDFATARSYLGGDFLSYYNDFTKQIVAPAAKQKSMKTTAHITGAAVSELHPYSAVVLVFVDQTTETKDNPEPSLALSSVLVHLNRVNGKWLITKFTPV
jgi:Mce-associated membrane protein